MTRIEPQTTNKMTKNERILALDAALVAAENCGEERIETAISALQDAIEEYWNDNNEYPLFIDYLRAQYQAVNALKENPQVFGADHASIGE